jgi:PAS domain S-box-containing protein
MRDEAAAEATFEGDPPVATTEETLRDRRELALVAVERTRMPMVVSDARKPDHPIMLANQAFLDLTGYSAAEVIGRNCRFLQGPDTDPADITRIRERLAAGDEVHVELLNYRKDGTSFWNQLAIGPIVDEKGQLLYHFASQKDVSARRRAEQSEQAERLLLMEVDHRAMNALALVQSFVRLGRADTVEAYAAAVQLRVDALARAHRLLAHNGWSGAALDELIILEIPDSVAPQVTVAGPALALAARVVQPLALALHEMMTNALAHGALSHADGMLEIGWEIAEGRARLAWRERGAARSEKSGDGLGLTLVRGVVERQLGGILELDWADQGLDARLIFAIDGAPRAANDGRTRPFRSVS